MVVIAASMVAMMSATFVLLWDVQLAVAVSLQSSGAPPHCAEVALQVLELVQS